MFVFICVYMYEINKIAKASDINGNNQQTTCERDTFYIQGVSQRFKNFILYCLQYKTTKKLY